MIKNLSKNTIRLNYLKIQTIIFLYAEEINDWEQIVQVPCCK
jgi:hypothetical protein